MADSVTATAANPIVAKDGGFEVLNKDGKTTEKITFTALLVRIGIRSLDTGRESFAAQFTLSQERVKQMEELNAISDMVSNFRNNAFASDAKSTAASGWPSDSSKLTNLINAFNAKYPNNQIAGGTSSNFTKGQIMTLESNVQSLSSTLSTQSEQQTTRTNQAMNRSSNFLQQLQTMMQAAKDALATAARTGSAG
jgi:hypothetical protein